MKKFINNRLYAIAVLFLLASCYEPYSEDPNVANPDFREVSDLNIVSVDENIYNLLDIASANISFELEKTGGLEISEVRLLQSFNQSDFQLISTVGSLPASIDISIDEAVALTDKSAAELVPGDNFVYSFEVVLASGDVVKSGLIFSANATCPSEIPAGTWVSNVPDGSGGFYEIDIVDNGGGAYDIANFNLDYLPSFYGTFTSLPIGAGFTDICNELTLDATKEFGVQWRGSGTYDPVTSTITFPSISESAFGQGPWDNGGSGYVFIKK